MNSPLAGRNITNQASSPVSILEYLRHPSRLELCDSLEALLVSLINTRPRWTTKEASEFFTRQTLGGCTYNHRSSDVVGNIINSQLHEPHDEQTLTATTLENPSTMANGDIKLVFPHTILRGRTDYHRCPYVVGKKIDLQLNKPYEGQTVTATIVKTFEPFTLSCAMVVRLDCPTFASESDMVLKLFDPRFAMQLREDEKVGPWTSSKEQKYHKFILDGGASELIADLDDENGVAHLGSQTWNEAQNEAHLFWRMSELFDTEVAAYNALEDTQGITVPKMFASVKIPSSTGEQEAQVKQYTNVSGLLLQYIDGFPLTDIADYAPRETWQFVCEEAIRILHVTSDHGILNDDVNTRNFIVQRNKQNEYRVFMIDFGLCSFREDFDDEADWIKWKAITDEEGAVGVVMHAKLKSGFVYTPSSRYTYRDPDDGVHSG